MKFNCAYDELLDIHKVMPNPDNNNRHTIEQIKRLAKIIGYQGQRSPIVISTRTGFITKGHCRLEAMKELGWEKVAVDFQEYESAAQEYADMTADNEIARWAELDRHAVYTKLEALPEIDIELLGIENFELPIVDVLDPEKEDDVPEVLHDPIARKGDVWLLGNHRVMCGDSTMIDDVEKLMKGEKADMVFTDPPYGMNLKTEYAKEWGEQSNTSGNIGFRETKNHRAVIGDDKPFDFKTFYAIFEDIKEQFWWGADYYCQEIPTDGGWLVWDKTGGNDSLMPVGFNANFELVWTKQKHKRDLYRHTYKGVAGMKPEDGKRVHPTQKPIGLCEKFIEKYSKEKVVDLFLGSGSTLIACEKTNRKCYGMELDEHYCDVIINRWQQYTGKEAVLESTGETYKSIYERERNN